MADLTSSRPLMKEVKGKINQTRAMAAVAAKQKAKGHSPINPAGKTKGWAKGATVGSALAPRTPTSGKVTFGDRTLPPVGKSRSTSPVLNPAQRPQTPQSGTINMGDKVKKANRGQAVSQSRHIRNRAAKAYRSYTKGKTKFRPGA